MPLLGMGRLNADTSHQELVETVAKMQKALDYLLQGGLDSKNIRVDGIEARNIKAGAIVAEKIDVDQLSAITADLGTIIAGIIYGAYIATANGTYPRIEFDSTGNFLAALASATNELSVVPSSGGVPALQFLNSSYGGILQLVSNTMQILSVFGTNLEISASGGNLNLSGSSVTISTGATGTFESVDGKIVTVVKGVVTSII